MCPSISSLQFYISPGKEGTIVFDTGPEEQIYKDKNGQLTVVSGWAWGEAGRVRMLSPSGLSSEPISPPLMLCRKGGRKRRAEVWGNTEWNGARVCSGNLNFKCRSPDVQRLTSALYL